MSNRTLAVAGLLLPLLAAGCLSSAKHAPGWGRANAGGCEEETVRVKAPPQKIYLEQPECRPEEAEKERRPEAAPEKKEARPEAARQPERERAPRQPEAEAQPESVAGTLGTIAALGQVASLARTTALTSPIGTVTPGAAGLGFGIRWVHIPIPFLHIFSVQETPSITVPLNEANLLPAGYETAYTGMVAAPGRTACGRQLSREEIAELVAQELAAQRPLPRRKEAAAPPPSHDDAERRQLEKKLSDAEAQIERLSKVLQRLDEKLPAGKPDEGNGRPREPRGPARPSDPGKE
jgi:hypothetical protein